VRAVSDAIKQAAAVKNARRSEKLLNGADRQLARHERAAKKERDRIAASVGADDARLLDEEAEAREAAMRADIRDAQRSFIRTHSSWLDCLDDDTRENLLKMVAMRCRGLCTPSEYRAAVKAAETSVRGPEDDGVRWRAVSYSAGSPLRGGW
jgi:hypothetical protein